MRSPRQLWLVILGLVITVVGLGSHLEGGRHVVPGLAAIGLCLVTFVVVNAALSMAGAAVIRRIVGAPSPDDEEWHLASSDDVRAEAAIGRGDVVLACREWLLVGEALMKGEAEVYRGALGLEIGAQILDRMVERSRLMRGGDR